MLSLEILYVFIFICVLSSSHYTEQLTLNIYPRISNLRTEGLINPLGIHKERPLLSWEISFKTNNRYLYKATVCIRAAKSRDKLTKNPIWNSETIYSHVSSIRWNGPVLRSSEKIFWQAKVCSDGLNCSAWSEINFFQMGLLTNNDWNSSLWIENKQYQTGATSLPYFVKRFTISSSVVSGTLWVTGLGQYIATINGEKVSESYLNPGYFDWNKTIEYSVYDISQLLSHGGNVIGVALGKGIYRTEQPLDGRYSKFITTPHPMKLLAKLQIDYEDGSNLVIVSDNTWLTTVTGPFLESSWYGGEEYDARQELVGWDTFGYNHSTWRMADISTIPNPNATYRAQEYPPIKFVQEIQAVVLRNLGNATYVFDLGMNHAGLPQLAMKGYRGSKVILKPAELLKTDGSIEQVTEGMPIFDRYTFKGNGTEIETYMPTFRYHGLRYLQVEGLLFEPQLSDLRSFVLRVSNEITGTFNTSDELLNRIHSNVNRAVQSNMMSIFTDCPHREKLGWLEETHLVYAAIERFFDIQAHGRSIVRRIAEAQLQTGLVPSTAPEFPIFDGGFRDEPNWGNTIVLLPLYLYQTYEDISILEEFYPFMVSWVNYLQGKATNFTLSYGLGDWFSIDQSTPLGVTATYGFWITTQGVAKIAHYLNRTKDEQYYIILAKNISSAFHDLYYNSTAHIYATGSQASHVLALEMGAVPLTEEKYVVDHLIQDILLRNNHTSVGEVALPSWFRMLSKYGHDEIVHAFLMRTDSPSYGYAVVHGATSLTEDWDGPVPSRGQALVSQNHFMFGAVDEWLTHSLAGIQQTTYSIGYRDIVIKPKILKQLSFVRSTYRSIRGWIKVNWKLTCNIFTLKLTIPHGAIAHVHVPGENATSSDASSKVATLNNESVFRVLGGFHTFNSVLPKHFDLKYAT